MAGSTKVFRNMTLTLPSGEEPKVPSDYNETDAPSRLFKPVVIPRYNHLFKLIIIGDQSVGKTNLTMKFCEYDYSPNYVATIGIDFKVKTIDIGERRVKLQIWDTAGQERFQSMSRMYYRGAQGVLFVYDVTHRPSFENVQNWVSTYEHASGDFVDNPEISKVLIGNKCDNEEFRMVRYEEGEAIANCYKLTFFETSAKTGYNVEEAFTFVAKEILSRVAKDLAVEAAAAAAAKKRKQRNRRGWYWSCNLL